MDRYRRSVAVTGIGVVSSLGHDPTSFWQACVEGKSISERVPLFWEQYYQAKSCYWSPLQLPDYASIGLKRSDILSVDPAALNAIYAAEQAIESSGCKTSVISERSGRRQIDSFDSFRCGAFVGTGLGCITSTFQNYVPHLLAGYRDYLNAASTVGELATITNELKENLGSQPRVLPIASTKSMANSISALLSIRYGLRGPNETCVAACAAGATAIARAYELISRGKLDFAIAGGTEYFGDRAGGVFMAFDRLNTLARGDESADKVNRPFDAARTGFLFSQGGACVLALESLEAAGARGAQVLAILKGASTTSDAYSLVALEPKGDSIRRMIHDALEDASVDIDEIDYVNAHGTGTIQNDALEASVIDTVFRHKPYVNSTKSLLGHTIGACGALEAAVSVLSIWSGELHPSVNLEHPVRDMNFVRKRTRSDIRIALTHNFGFGGHNVGLIFGKE